MSAEVETVDSPPVEVEESKVAVEEPPADVAEERKAATLIAVCGIGGGAGTSTLAFLTAMYAQRVAPAPLLLCDTGGPAASLAVLAEKQSQLSLPQAAAAIGADALGVPLFVPLTPKLRLIARDPDFDDALDSDGLARLLRDARAAHPITIVDCGTLQRPVERAVAEQASSILWTAQGSPAGARRAQAALRSLPLRAEREILAVWAGERRSSAVEHELMSAADLHGASVVFVPALPEVSQAGLDTALEAGQVALEAIRGRLT
jgi:Flp pilus assembly CpaE family ATPase